MKGPKSKGGRSQASSRGSARGVAGHRRSHSTAPDVASRQWRESWQRVMGRVLRVAAGDPWPAHHNGGQLRQRRHDGCWQKVGRGAMLPPKWKAGRKRKRLGPGEFLAVQLQRAVAPNQVAIEQFGRTVTDSVAWLRGGVAGDWEQEDAP